MSDIAIRQEQRQHQTLTPRLQQAVRLLQLSSLDFAHAIEEAMEKNPFLEPDDGEADTNAAAPEHTPVDPATTLSSANDVAEAPQDAIWGADSWSQLKPKRHDSGDGGIDLTELTAADVSLRDHLHQQLAFFPASARDLQLMHTLVEAIDDDGYLRVELEELKTLSALEPAPDEAELSIALKLVQSLEPAGVGARDLRECLLLQLREASPDVQDTTHELAVRAVSDHLELLAAHSLAALARQLGVGVEAAQAAVDRVRRLQPRPGWRFGATGTRFIVPDVVVRKVRNTWTVALNHAIVPRVRLNEMYAALFRSHRDASHADLAGQLQEARWTVRNVEQRFATIVRVAQEIVRRQHHFFEYGELAMKPLGLREIADALDLHESTVSRVTNNKYMATPLGVFELKYFFSRALATVSGGTCSSTAIRGAIKDVIAAESPAAPMSDVQIARLLARQGLRVARRTVTKYRQSMRVPAYEMRRRAA